MSTAEVKFARTQDVREHELKAWNVVRQNGDEIEGELGRLLQPRANKRAWTFEPVFTPYQLGSTTIIAPALDSARTGEVVGESKLEAIRVVKTKFAEIVQAPVTAEPTDHEQQVSARIAALEAKIAETTGKPEFARVAAACKGQITRLRKSLPTSSRPEPGKVAA